VVLLQNVYNVTGMSFTPSDLAASIRKQRPDFRIAYEPDFRQVSGALVTASELATSFTIPFR
jgi:hypothetical protein